MARIAIITARGGSKRIPKKNIRLFCGKPILAYSIEAAKGSGMFDEVMVSTDSEEIAKTAESFGASVPFLRSSRTSGDFATTADVIGEVLDEYAARGKSFEAFLCIYPTAPFVTAERLAEASVLLDSEGKDGSVPDAVVPVVRFSFPPQRGFIEADGYLQYRWPENAFKRSQDLEAMYHDAGQFYLVRTQAFLTERTVVPKKTAPLILPEMLVQDIDNEEDWEIAEIKYRKRFM